MILINNNIKLACLSAEERNRLRNICTITNPKFTQAMSLNLNVYGISESLRYYEYDRKKDILEVPVGLLDVVKKMFPKETLIDRRLADPEIEIPVKMFS